MLELKTNAVEVLRKTVRTSNIGAPPFRWQARCNACDWTGPERTTRSAAEDDADAHSIAQERP